jgi:hypothetical protein
MGVLEDFRTGLFGVFESTQDESRMKFERDFKARSSE